MPKVSKICNRNWTNNNIQYPRLIEEAQAAGAFTSEVLQAMSESMSLEVYEIEEILDRAMEDWEDIKSRTFARKL